MPAELDTTEGPQTREVLLAGLRQALQVRVGNIWNNVTLAGETDSAARFKEGVERSVKFYEKAWRAINDMVIKE